MQHLLDLFWQLNYISVFILMMMESSIIPVPSEAVMIPAWYLASTWSLNIFLVILAWWIWSLVWAIINYFVLWQLIWKPFLLKYWKYFLITEKKYHKAESLFLKNDNLYTFLWRFIPVVRHLISIPAWIFKMNFLHFSILTFVWATLWCLILTLVWYYFGNWIVEIFHKYTTEANIIIAILIIIFVVWFIKRKD